MNGKSASSNAHPLGTVTKDDVVIIGSKAFQVVAGEARLYPNGSLEGSHELYDISLDIVDDLHDDGIRVFEVTESYVGRWR